MNCMKFKIVGTLHIIVVGERDPTQDDWTTYIRALINEERRGVEIGELRTLVFSDGGGPNAAQRRLIGDILKGRSSPIAIVTDNALMRGVITALQWFNPQCRTFAPHAVGEALKFLGVPLQRYDAIIKVARQLQSELLLPRLQTLDSARLDPYVSSSLTL